MLVRATGRVLRTDYKSGAKTDPTTGEIRPWSFNTVKVLVAEQDIVEVTMFGDSTTPVPHVGAEIDWAVVVQPRGGRVNVQLDKPWADLFAPVDAGKHKAA